MGFIEITNDGFINDIDIRETLDTTRREWFIDKSNGKKCLFKKRLDRTDNITGEYLGYLLAQKAGISVCNVKLAKKNEIVNEIDLFNNGPFSLEFNYTPLDNTTYGILSYVETDEKLISLYELLRTYEQKTGIEISDDHNIETIFKSIESLAADHSKEAVIKEVIKILIYDLYTNNRDRNTENLSFIVGEDGKIKAPYPMYDNEAILGFRFGFDGYADATEYIQSRESSTCFFYQENKNDSESTTSNLINTTQGCLKYLFDNYYDETLEAIISMNRITLEDLTALIDLSINSTNIIYDFQGIDQNKIHTAVEVFKIQKKIINKQLEKYREIREKKEDSTDITLTLKDLGKVSRTTVIENISQADTTNNIVDNSVNDLINKGQIYGG